MAPLLLLPLAPCVPDETGGPSKGICELDEAAACGMFSEAASKMGDIIQSSAGRFCVRSPSAQPQSIPATFASALGWSGRASSTALTFVPFPFPALPLDLPFPSLALFPLLSFPLPVFCFLKHSSSR